MRSNDLMPEVRRRAVRFPLGFRAGGWATGVLLAATLVLGTCDPTATSNEPTVLRIALRDYPLTLDPHLRSELVTFSVLGNIYESLVGFDPEGRVHPELALRWTNPDDRTWLFELRPGVTFHDGRPLLARDVVASLQRARSHPDTNLASFLVHVEKVRSRGDHLVEITTDEPHPILLNKLAYVGIVPADSPSTAEIRDPIGSGPYRAVDWQKGEWIRLESYGGHRHPAPISVLEFHCEPSAEQRLEGLRQGRFGLIQELPPQWVEDVRAERGIDARVRSTARMEYLAINPSFAPFDDPRVREAIDLAIDREIYVEREAGGFGEPLVQLAARSVFGHNPELLPAPARPRKARALLAEAGFADGLRLVLEARQGRAVSEIVRQLGEVGIEVEVRFLPWDEMFDRVLAEQVAFYYDGIIAVSLDASDVLDHVAHSRNEATGFGEHNRVGYSNPEVDRLTEEGGETLNPTIRGRLLAKALELTANDRFFIALFSPDQIWGAIDDLDWKPRLDGMVVASEMSMRDASMP